LSAVLVAVLAALAHGPALGGGFVYDDVRFIEANPALTPIDPVGYFTDPATASATQGVQADIYRPLRTLHFAVDHAVFGKAPQGWHVTNLLLHVLNSLLVLRLLRPLVGGNLVAATGGATLFAVHPVAVECVAWVSSRGDLLAVALLLGALWALERRGAGRTVAGAVLMVLACFAKESALVLPALLLLRDLALPGDRALPRKVTWVRVGVLGALAVAYLGLRLAVIPELAQVNEFIGGSRGAAARGMLAGLSWYAGALVWPTGFPFDLHLEVPLHWSDPPAVLGLGLLLTLLAAGVWGLRRGLPLLAFACLGALACLVPVSNVIVPLKGLVAERFLYPVLICAAAGVALVLWRLPEKPRWAAAAVVLVAVLVLVPVSRARAEAWHDDLTLWETVLRERPDHMRAYEGLGFEYLKAGRLYDAETAYRSYLEYNPADGKAQRLLGDVYGRVAAALEVAAPQPGIEIEGLDARRRQARMAQLLQYRSAITTWQRIGLTAGRGSPELLASTLEAMIKAAWEIGDLPKAKEANDALLDLEGIDPRDRAAVEARGSLPRRRTRMNLAFRALSTDIRQDLPREAYREQLRQRAVLLEDVGLDPGRPKSVLLREMLARARALAADPGVVGYLRELQQRAMAPPDDGRGPR
jgi:tetratricopeptide (TPR) repeat protein